jgi:hypothetical protein
MFKCGLGLSLFHYVYICGLGRCGWVLLMSELEKEADFIVRMILEEKLKALGEA